MGGKRSNVRFELAEAQNLISCIIYNLQNRELDKGKRALLIASGRRLKQLETRLIQNSQKK
jgi:hypothetical protein